MFHRSTLLATQSVSIVAFSNSHKKEQNKEDSYENHYQMQVFFNFFKNFSLIHTYVLTRCSELLQITILTQQNFQILSYLYTIVVLHNQNYNGTFWKHLVSSCYIIGHFSFKTLFLCTRWRKQTKVQPDYGEIGI